MRNIILGFILLSVLLANPMLSSSKVQQQPITQQNSITIFSPVISKIVSLQKDIRNEISTKTRAIKQEPTGKYLFIILGAVFLYGFFHALGPGHGKVIAISYFIGAKANVLKGVSFGFLFSIMHSMSALIVFLVMMGFSKLIPVLGGAGYEQTMQQISFYLISILGVYVFFKGFNNIRKDVQEEDNLQHMALPLALGIVPCPGTLLFLTFFSMHKMFWLGILSVFLIALGMATALSIISVFVIMFREKALSMFDNNKSMHLGNYLTMLGGVLLVFLGLYLAK